jgi:integrase
MAINATTWGKPRKYARRPDCEPCEMDILADKIITLYKDNQYSRRTVSQTRRAFRIAIEEAGIKSVADLDDNGVVRYIRALKKGYPDLPPSVSAELLRRLQAICGHLLTFGDLEALPKFPPIPQAKSFKKDRQPAIPAPQAIRRLLEHLHRESGTWDGLRLYSLVVVVVYTGLNLRHAIGLLIEDVDFNDDLIKVRKEEIPRSVAPKRVSLPAEAKLILKAWIPKTGCAWLFPGKRRTGPWCTGNAGIYGPCKPLRTAGAAVGIPNLTFDTLRLFFKKDARTRPHSLDGAAKPPGTCVVTLEEETRRAFIRGKDMAILTHSRFKLVKLLHDAGPQGLSATEMDQSEEGGWRQTLLGLRKSDPAWLETIVFPGGPYGGNYRLAWSPA